MQGYTAVSQPSFPSKHVYFDTGLGCCLSIRIKMFVWRLVFANLAFSLFLFPFICHPDREKKEQSEVSNRQSQGVSHS